MATLLTAERMGQSPRASGEVEVPAPTAWPFVLAFGFTLMFAGLLTSVSISVLGAVLAVAGCAGWFREVFPHEHEVIVPLVPEEIRIATERRVVERLPVAADQLRAWLPVHTYPISAGRNGGVGRRLTTTVLSSAGSAVETGSHSNHINLLATPACAAN